ncbi:MAG: chemotaxis response regulator protein-glutamate methylesterase [Leptonema sp. (in: bacteria)]
MIKVLIVDDSAIIRDSLSKYLSNFQDIQVVGVAPDPFVARDKILKLKPDVITLDIEMPRMDGLSFLEKLMVYYPIPVIIVSSITKKDPNSVIKAMELGAFDVVNKSNLFSVQEVLEEILVKIRNAYESREEFLKKFQKVSQSHKIKKHEIYTRDIQTTDKIIAIGASTGGTVAIEFILSNLPKNIPPIVVVQHMPMGFTYQFANRLNEISNLEVKEAQEGDLLEIGKVLIAKGGYHLKVIRKGNHTYTHLDTGEKVYFQKPSVDVLFYSVAENFGKNSIAILLTGMGRDGSTGLKKIKELGGYTIVQDEESSIVWGMPKAAIDLGAHNEILPLNQIPQKILKLLS